ncbi:uncharacterized protein LOC111384471 [Olea europaea var. sylvestris]|uniref:uncharacterized protein LOC111384471 n=1 Tax=Olea europaea var. sylvestris TaxID=158386 RepID=UPI000C1CDFDA|nr:uncharacterized protein LOC111384471 [Olea europaea var. sylvestris]
MRIQRHKMGADDFELLTMIGKGAFGEVENVKQHCFPNAFNCPMLEENDFRNDSTGMVYAMKFSHISNRDLVNMANKRVNVIPFFKSFLQTTLRKTNLLCTVLFLYLERESGTKHVPARSRTPYFFYRD